MSGYRLPVTSFLLCNVKSIQHILDYVIIGELLDVNKDNTGQIIVYKNKQPCGYIHKNILRGGIIPERVQVFAKENIVEDGENMITLRVVPIHRGRGP
jgi:hypothetical protein